LNIHFNRDSKQKGLFTRRLRSVSLIQTMKIPWSGWTKILNLKHLIRSR